MNRNELEHIIRAAGEIAKVKKVIILGSQSILAQFPNLSKSISELDSSEISLMIKNREICNSSAPLRVYHAAIGNSLF